LVEKEKNIFIKINSSLGVKHIPLYKEKETELKE